jgi:hypothetical protein
MPVLLACKFQHCRFSLHFGLALKAYFMSCLVVLPPIVAAELVSGAHRTKDREQFGNAKGMVKMAEDFDSPIGDFRGLWNDPVLDTHAFLWH